MKRALVIFACLVIAVSIAANVYFLRERTTTAAELAKFGLVREDPVLTATLDTLRRERAFGDSMRRESAKLKASASAAVTDYRRRRDSLLTASIVRTPSPSSSIDTSAVSIVPVPDSSARSDTTSGIAGTLWACDAAIAALEARALTCEIRADSADARAARAEKAAVRADSGRRAAVDSAGSAIKAAGRRGFWRDLKAAAIGIGILKIVETIATLAGVF